MPDQFYTVQELATVLKLTEQAIYKWIKQDKTAAVRYCITIAEVDRVVRERVPKDGVEEDREEKKHSLRYRLGNVANRVLQVVKAK